MISTISLCMIVRDAEETIARCLASVIEGVDEVIIVDTGSIDNTKNIVKLFGDKVKLYDFKWIDDFGAARNFAFSKATMDYQMWLDADDVVTSENLKKLIKIKETLNSNMVITKYNLAYDDNKKPTFFGIRERLFKTKKNFKWIDRVHECIPYDEDTIFLDFEVNHISVKTGISTRNVDIYDDMVSKNEEFTPRNNFYYAKELLTHNRNDEATYRFTLFLSEKDIRPDDAILAYELLHDIALKSNDQESAMMYLYKTFDYDLPRPKICYLLGCLFKAKNKLDQAIYWVEKSLSLNDNNQTFINTDHKFLSLIELCYIYFQKGNITESLHYHNEAVKINPNHPAVKYNEEYFVGINPSNSSNTDIIDTQ